MLDTSLSSPSAERSAQLLENRSDRPPRGSRRLRTVLVLTDIASVTLAYLLSAALMGSGSDGSPIRTVAWSVGCSMFGIAASRLYLARVSAVRTLETAALLRATLISAALIAITADRFQPGSRAWSIVATQVVVIVFVLLGRSLYRMALRRARREGRFMRRVVLIGTGDESFELAQLLADEPELGYEIVGLVGDQGDALRRGFALPVMGGIDAAADVVRATKASGAIIGASSLSFRDLNRVVRDLLQAGAHVQISGGLAGISATRYRANPIGREAAFYLEHVSLAGWQSRVKRVVDVIVASILLIPAAPIIAVLSIIVRRTDGGPAFFRQKRVGLNNEEFTMLKIRTMVVDAEARLAALKADNERSGPLFKMKDDPRFTPIGRFMDATSLNELPQLINVLRGDMSIVGPRPALAREVAKFDERLLIRHRVRPGITGLWQVESRDSPSFADYERCDVFYVENWSVQLDLAIMLQTFGEVLRRALGKSTSNEMPTPTAIEHKPAS
jgi:exopolysaccharide biosynthesis polyprenyl glycosylphosphotransferase